MRIAALDLGTNSFHLLIADVHPDGSFTPLAREKEMLRLGDSVSREGFIPPEAADAAVATVRRMKMLAEAADATEIVACATSAIRLAANGDELVDRIERETGVKVDVINGLTEARLIFGAIRASVLLEPAPDHLRPGALHDPRLEPDRRVHRLHQAGGRRVPHRGDEARRLRRTAADLQLSRRGPHLGAERPRADVQPRNLRRRLEALDGRRHRPRPAADALSRRRIGSGLVTIAQLALQQKAWR